MTRKSSPVWQGTVAMSEERYCALAAQAGEHLLELRPYAVPVSEVPGMETCAVYVAVNSTGLACYAGQTMPVRAVDEAASRRIRGHLRSPSKAAEWREYWVLPLRDGTPPAAIRRIEAAVCARLGLPVVNRRWRSAEARRYGVTA